MPVNRQLVNPKSEARNPQQIRNPNVKCPKQKLEDQDERNNSQNEISQSLHSFEVTSCVTNILGWMEGHALSWPHNCRLYVNGSFCGSTAESSLILYWILRSSRRMTNQGGYRMTSHTCDSTLCHFEVAVRLRNRSVGATTGGCPYDSIPFFVIFVLFLRALRGLKTREQGTGDRVKNSLQLAVDSCQEPVNVAKLEYWSTGIQTVDRGLTTVDRSPCILHRVS